MKHTPGPWTAEQAATNSIAIGPGDMMVIELIADGGCDPPNRLTEEDWANARLIAAAPELIEALRQCMPQIHQCASANCAADGHRECPYGLARAAIAKAEGKP